MPWQLITISQYLSFVFWPLGDPSAKHWLFLNAPLLCLSSLVTLEAWGEWTAPNSLFVLGSFHIPSHRLCLNHTKPRAPSGFKMLRPDSVPLGSEDSEDTLLWLDSQLCHHHLWNLRTMTWSFWTWRFICCTNKDTHLIGVLSTSNELICINA